MLLLQMCHHRGFRIILCCFSKVAHEVIIVHMRWILIILLFQHVGRIGRIFCWLFQYLLMCPCRSHHSKCIWWHRSFYTALNVFQLLEITVLILLGHSLHTHPFKRTLSLFDCSVETSWPRKFNRRKSLLALAYSFREWIYNHHIGSNSTSR